MIPETFFIAALFIALTGSLILTWLLIWQKSKQASAKHAARRWYPPVGSGARLVVWASGLSESIARKLLSGRRTKQLPAEIATEMLSGASFAIEHLPEMTSHYDPGDCRTRKFTRIGVTAPEILAIADMIRPNKQEATRIHDLAVENTKRLAEGADEGDVASACVCPLRSQDGSCLARVLCPLHCRVTCDLSDKVDPENVKTLEKVSRDVGFGIEVGLARALHSAGLDGHVYELNSALAVALEHPDASKKWAAGENVLADCARNDYTAYYC